MNEIELNKKKVVSKNEKKKKLALMTICYIVAAVLFIVAIYTTVINIIYVKNYALTYGVSVGTMWKDFASYVISGFIPNFSYAFIVFVLGQIIGMLFEKKYSYKVECYDANADVCVENEN